MKRKKQELKKILADKGRILFFERDNMKLEIANKINLNNFINFMLDVFVELIIAKYNKEKNDKMVAKQKVEFIRKMAGLN